MNTEENFVLDTESTEFLKHIGHALEEKKIDREDKANILFNLINRDRG